MKQTIDNDDSIQINEVGRVGRGVRPGDVVARKDDDHFPCVSSMGHSIKFGHRRIQSTQKSLERSDKKNQLVKICVVPAGIGKGGDIEEVGIVDRTQGRVESGRRRVDYYAHPSMELFLYLCQMVNIHYRRLYSAQYSACSGIPGHSLTSRCNQYISLLETNHLEFMTTCDGRVVEQQHHIDPDSGWITAALGAVAGGSRSCGGTR